MIQNGILLTFKRLFWHVLDMRLSFLCLFFSFLTSWKLHRQASWISWQNPPRLKPEDVCLPPHLATRHGPNIYGSQSTSSSERHVHYVFTAYCFPLSTCLSGFLVPSASTLCFHCPRLLICPSFYVCVESLLEFDGQGWAASEMDFSQHWMKFGNWNMPFTI